MFAEQPRANPEFGSRTTSLRLWVGSAAGTQARGLPVAGELRAAPLNDSSLRGSLWRWDGLPASLRWAFARHHPGQGPGFRVAAQTHPSRFLSPTQYLHDVNPQDVRGWVVAAVGAVSLLFAASFSCGRRRTYRSGILQVCAVSRLQQRGFIKHVYGGCHRMSKAQLPCQGGRRLS